MPAPDTHSVKEEPMCIEPAPCHSPDLHSVREPSLHDEPAPNMHSRGEESSNIGEVASKVNVLYCCIVSLHNTCHAEW